MEILNVVSAIVGRDPTRQEIADALGVHVSTISRRMSGGEGFRLEEILLICRFFRLSDTEVLIRLGVLDADDVGKAAKRFVRPMAEMDDSELLQVLADRAAKREETQARSDMNRGRERGLFN